MSIDTKEWGGKLNEMGMLPEVVSFSRFTQWVIDLIRAVIADEAAKPVSFVGKGATNYVGMPSYEELLAMTRSQKPAERPDEPAKSADEVFAKAQPDEPRAEGDVPEWDVLYRRFIDHKGWWLQSVLDVIKPAYESLRSELTRRVAEATAGRDRRIAELEFDVRHADCRTQSQKQWLANKDRRIAELEAECERLRNARCNIFSKGNKCDCTLCKQDAELTTLRQQLADATRPVEGVEELVELTCKESFASFDAVSWLSVKSLMANAAKKAIQRERAARVAAEAERDELREFVRTRYLETRTGSGVCKPREHGPVTDAQFAEAFAAYRAEKGKVAK